MGNVGPRVLDRSERRLAPQRVIDRVAEMARRLGSNGRYTRQLPRVPQ